MQNVLAIDTTVEPYQAHVVRIVERGNTSSLEIIESVIASKDSGNLNANLLAWKGAELSKYVNSFKDDTSETSSDELSDEEKQKAAQLEQITSGINNFKSALGQLRNTWLTTVMIVPAKDYLSLNMDMPFGDAKNLNKIIDFEVQDVVPFDVGDFLVQPQAVSKSVNKSFDVHVSLIPKNFIKNVISVCKVASVEPIIITTPASVIGALYHMGQDYFADNSALIMTQDNFCSIICKINGELRADRVLDASTYDAGLGAGSLTILNDIKLSLANIERRYLQKIEKIYFVGEPQSASFFKQSLGRAVEVVNLDEFIKSTDVHAREENRLTASIAGLSAIYAQDMQAPAPLTNFRINEFSFSPQLHELFAGLKKLLPFAITLLVAGFIALLTYFGIREMYKARLENAIAQSIQKVLTDVPITQKGGEFAVLSAESVKMADTLKDLGSLSGLSPLATYAQISEDIKAAARDIKDKENFSVQDINIKGGVIEVKGSAPDYSAADSIRQHLERVKGETKKDLYCNVKMTVSRTTTPGKTTRPYTLGMQICEQAIENNNK